MCETQSDIFHDSTLYTLRRKKNDNHKLSELWWKKNTRGERKQTPTTCPAQSLESWAEIRRTSPQFLPTSKIQRNWIDSRLYVQPLFFSHVVSSHHYYTKAPLRLSQPRENGNEVKESTRAPRPTNNIHLNHSHPLLWALQELGPGLRESLPPQIPSTLLQLSIQLRSGSGSAHAYGDKAGITINTNLTCYMETHSRPFCYIEHANNLLELISH